MTNVLLGKICFNHIDWNINAITVSTESKINRFTWQMIQTYIERKFITIVVTIRSFMERSVLWVLIDHYSSFLKYLHKVKGTGELLNSSHLILKRLVSDDYFAKPSLYFPTVNFPATYYYVIISSAAGSILSRRRNHGIRWTSCLPTSSCTSLPSERLETKRTIFQSHQKLPETTTR